MNTTAPPGARKAVFWLILVLLPALFFAVLELAVRAMGLGSNYPLFIPVDAQPGYLQPNPDVVKRYFSRPELAPKVSPDTQYFHAEKPADSKRIVILGESSAAGFPYGRFGSLSGMLEQRFRFLYPEANIEVISVAMAAINSYTMRDFSREVLAIKPDIVLIYAGHNEYLGVMGVGSALAARDSRWKTLSYISLRHSHLFQLLDSVIASWRLDGAAKPEAVSERTLMAKVAANKDIAFNSPAYQQGLRQFESNMRDIIADCRAANIPVVIGTLASNERDQPPFASEGRADETLQGRLSTAGQLRLEGNLTSATKALKAIIGDYPLSADAQFALAQVEQANNNDGAAVQHYLLAKDYDLLRFRAPEAINQAVSGLAQSGVYIADVQQALRTRSAQASIGFDLILEHLHPNMDGYFWLADTYLETLLKNNLLPAAASVPPLEKVKALMPISGVDQMVATWKVASLTSDYPFTSTPKTFAMGELNTPERQLAAARFSGALSWLQATEKAFNLYQGEKDWRNALVVVGQLSDALPMNVDVAAAAAHLATQLNEPALMLFYSQRGLRENPTKQEFLMIKAQALFVLGRLAESKRYLEQVAQLNPQHQMAKALLEQPWAKSIR